MADKLVFVDAFELWEDGMGGGGWTGLVYLDKKAAEIVANERLEEWISFKVKPVKLRVLNQTEGIVGKRLVVIHRQIADDLIRERALKKLDKEERRVLGL